MGQKTDVPCRRKSVAFMFSPTLRIYVRVPPVVTSQSGLTCSTFVGCFGGKSMRLDACHMMKWMNAMVTIEGKERLHD
jgi:hypothetical protein